MMTQIFHQILSQLQRMRSKPVSPYSLVSVSNQCCIQHKPQVEWQPWTKHQLGAKQICRLGLHLQHNIIIAQTNLYGLQVEIIMAGLGFWLTCHEVRLTCLSAMCKKWRRQFCKRNKIDWLQHHQLSVVTIATTFQWCLFQTKHEKALLTKFLQFLYIACDYCANV